MGFRKDAYAKVWSVEAVSDTRTKLRIGISRKNKQSGEYEQDFGDFVDCIGTAVAKKAANLKEGARIKLGDVDVTNKYDKEKNRTYYNFKIFSFEEESTTGTPTEAVVEASVEAVDDGEVNDQLPF